MSAVSDHLRDEVAEIAQQWEQAALSRLPHLHQLDRQALIDHLPEFVYGLAAWVEGNEEAGRHGFEALAEGHAVQRLGHGIDLQTLSTEYQILRTVILQHLLLVASSEAVRNSLVRLNDGIDYAVNEAIRRYSGSRDKSRERFVGILGHDLRVPLSAVALAAAQISANPCTDPKHARMAATIQNSSDRMVRMIADVIDFTHAHLGQGIPAVPALADLGEICEEAVSELRLNHPEREIKVELAGDLRSHVDRDRVIQALSNLIGNAIQHGKDPIIVSAREATEQDAVVTEVKNFGTTIPPEIAPRLFDPFRVGHEATHRPRTNLGLGLYIVQQIALSHGANCTARSDATETVFEIRWPRVPIASMPNRG